MLQGTKVITTTSYLRQACKNHRDKESIEYILCAVGKSSYGFLGELLEVSLSALYKLITTQEKAIDESANKIR